MPEGSAGPGGAGGRGAAAVARRGDHGRDGNAQRRGHLQPLAVAQDRRAVDHRGQFADVSRPGIGDQQCQVLGRRHRPGTGRSAWRPAGQNAAPSRQCPRGAPATAAARWERPRSDTTGPRGTCPSATMAARSRCVAATIRTSTLIGRCPAHAVQPAVLEDPQQADLGRQRQLAEFVQQQRAAVGALEPALAGFDRAGERPLLVAEQLRIDQLVGDRAAIDADERPAGPAASGCGSRGPPTPCPSPSRRRSARARRSGRPVRRAP